MLKLSTKRPSMELEVDGEVREIPLTFTATELVALNRAEDETGAMFGFFAAYVPGFEELGDDQLGAVLAEWKRLREAIGEPDLGE